MKKSRVAGRESRGSRQLRLVREEADHDHDDEHVHEHVHDHDYLHEHVHVP